ncbi:hypothetical protein E4O00_06230 [Treponema sp. OMZ 788]|uniref:hypothetical protein n=1 Tax=Treponema sp. OMZ 788 TaxID=2563664 RepID=UPI0020A5D050|nr:hypothetical protein [Treponema sp. OMZ 788]UTC65669.1 hypothetical protein E4O00_06230 [Treponema sp. OMZ 788]
MIAFFTSCCCYAVWNIFIYFLFNQGKGTSWIYNFNPAYMIISLIIYFMIRKIWGQKNNIKLTLCYILGCLTVFGFTFSVCCLLYYESLPIGLLHLFMLLLYYPVVAVINIFFLYINDIKITLKKIFLTALTTIFVIPYSFLLPMLVFIINGGDPYIYILFLILEPIELIKNGGVISGLAFFEIIMMKIYIRKG